MAFETLFDMISDNVPDHRREGSTIYPLNEMFLLCFCATIANCDGWTEIEDYGKSKLDYLRKFLPFSHGIPSDNTLGRFFSRVDPSAFRDCFVAFVKMAFPKAEGHVAIDGKTSKGSRFGECKALHTVSAYASETRVVLAQVATEEKSNEITAIPLLLDLIDIKGSAVTIDAMGCQTHIAEKIIGKGGHYVFGLKGNQKSLLAQAEALFASATGFADSFTRENEGHGRKEKRTCDVLCAEDVDFLRQNSEFPGLKSVARVTSERTVKGVAINEVRYYVSDLPPEAERIARAVRNHWKIENCVHWILDVSFNEDASKIRKDHAPFNLTIIRQLAVNLIKAVKRKNESIRRLRKMAAYDEAVLMRIVNLEIN